MQTDEFRIGVLESFGASGEQVAELLTYTSNVFEHEQPFDLGDLPLPDEPFADAWKGYAAAAETDGLVATLRQRLPQFGFPIRAGVSESPAYRQATRKGQFLLGDSPGLELEFPDQLQLLLHPSLAGAIPVLLPQGRNDFVTLLQALTAKNEPRSFPDSMGAIMISGYNNWDRVNQLRQTWRQEHPGDTAGRGWQKHFRERVVPNRELYQDRFIILSDGPYSGVEAASLALDDEPWRQLSRAIRLEHECTHYFTRRVCGSMRNNLLDELLADYRGIVHANERYRADWALWFLGLENFPEYRQGGRLENYRGDPPLSDAAMQVLGGLVVACARNLERYDQTHAAQLQEPRDQAQLLWALTRLSLEEIASEQFDACLKQVLNG